MTYLITYFNYILYDVDTSKLSDFTDFHPVDSGWSDRPQIIQQFDNIWTGIANFWRLSDWHVRIAPVSDDPDGKPD